MEKLMNHNSDSESETNGVVKMEISNLNARAQLEAAQLEAEVQLEAAQLEAALLVDQSLSSTGIQNSIFSLTLDEFQLRSGKNCGSMNIDELLNSVWTMDVQQRQQDHISTHFQTHRPIFPGQCSFNIPTPLFNKTVDEVWAEIQRNQSVEDQNQPDFTTNGVLERRLTFGDMTLEDFLVKLGAIHGGGPTGLTSSEQQNVIHMAPNPMTNTGSMNFSSSNTSFETNNIITDQPMMEIEFSQSVNGYEGCVLADNASNSMMYPMFAAPNGNIVIESTKAVIGNGSTGSSTKRRMASGSNELAIIERKQRRMIKNRESAARSRARKQAYTAELEFELNNLREENAELRNIVTEKEEEVERAKEEIKRKEEEEEEKMMMKMEEEKIEAEKRKKDESNKLRRTKSLN